MRFAAAILALAFVLVGGDAAAKGRHRRAPRKKATPPVAYYLADWQKGATRAAAIEKCQAEREKERRAHPELSRYASARPCDASVIVVRGPYRRARATSGDPYDDPRVYVSRGSDGTWYDATGDAPCFVAGTPVATPAGDVPIERVEAGAVVWSWDPSTAERVAGRVVRVKRRMTTRTQTIVLDDGRRVTATPNHPFFAADARAWIDVGRLSAGDALLSLEGEAARAVRIASKTTREEVGEVAVYDLTVVPHHDFFAGGVLVHNY